MTFRDHLYPPGHPRVQGLGALDPRTYVDVLRQTPGVSDVLADWERTFATTAFTGITSAPGPVPEETGLFRLADEGAPTLVAVSAAQRLLAMLDPDQEQAVLHPIDSRVWRAWLNPEIYLNQYGLRLEEVSEEVRSAVFGLLAACLSETGLTTVLDVMRTNEFLGELVGLPRLMNRHSYNLNLFGRPSATQAWGWNLWGHHLALNCLVVGGQVAFTPVFMGSEPNTIDTGEHAGVSLFGDQAALARALVRALPLDQADDAVLFRHKRDPAMPPGRLHVADELTLAGAFQDNRIIPLEGVEVSRFSAAHREQLMTLVARFLDYLPPGPLRARLADVRAHLHQTWFCWIGGTGADDPFYYRLQSPVIIAEFDHHAGVFLSNDQPRTFHTHTVVRTPNGNDYGVALRRLLGECPATLTDRA